MGPLEVRDGERLLRLGGAKQRSVLAILLLHAGEVVSADRLADLLWSGSPPENSATALQQHVSRLRRALEPHRVVRTREPGYVIDRSDADIDLHRFESMRKVGRGALESGAPGRAATVLREALDLWRGRPIDDLAFEPFAADAVAALEEMRIETVELRVEADLARGQAAELVAELRALVRAHPLRERLRAQLMLALYRAGRQAEALEAFTDARRELDELGLEPGPELRRLQQSVLEHDPALEVASARRAASARPRRRLMPAAAMGIASAIVVALTIGRGGDGGSPVTTAALASGALVALDAADGEARERIPIGRTPSAVAGPAGGRLWMVDADARTVLAVDPASGDVETLATGGTPAELAVGGGDVWVGNGRPLGSAQYIGPVVTRVLRIDPHTRTSRGDVRLPRARGTVSNAVENRLAATADAVWAVAPSGAVVRIDASSGEVTARLRRAGAIAIAAGPAGIWALHADARVSRLDDRTAEVRSRARLPTDSPTGLAVGSGAAFATSSADGTLYRIGEDGEVESVGIAAGVTDVAASDAGIWVANPLAGTVTRIDPERLSVTRSVTLDGQPRALLIAGGTLWVAVSGTEEAPATEVAGVRALPPSSCEPIVAGAAGEADALIVSDLPLQGGIHITAAQMVQAIVFTLRERGFRAGDVRVAFQSCDDSVARTGLFDVAKCAANARAYGRHEDVVAVIGTLNSDCALAAVPELNRAPGGPLAMVSPLNSFVGLTRSAPGIPPTLPTELYPTGTRSYLRVFPTDDLQGAALAQIARDRGRERVYVLDDGEPGYGRLMARGFLAAARELGLEISGRESWSPQSSSYARLARRVARSGADAVFVGGLLDTNAAQVVRDLRAADATVDILGPDGLTPLPLLQRRAGAAAHGVLVSLPGVVTEVLPPAGEQWVRRFARTQAGAVIEPPAVYAAQATEVVLDALERSDGTRASVLGELFATEVEGGLLGDFTIDPRGDISESPVTILRVGPGGGGSRRVQSVAGGVVERVARPAADLVD